MARESCSCDQIFNKLREAELQLRQGATVAIVSKTIGVSSHTYYRWHKEYGGLRIEQAKKLKTLEKENARLKKLIADLPLDNSILKEAAANRFDDAFCLRHNGTVSSKSKKGVNINSDFSLVRL